MNELSLRVAAALASVGTVLPNYNIGYPHSRRRYEEPGPQPMSPERQAAIDEAKIKAEAKRERRRQRNLKLQGSHE